MLNMIAICQSFIVSLFVMCLQYTFFQDTDTNQFAAKM